MRIRGAKIEGRVLSYTCLPGQASLLFYLDVMGLTHTNYSNHGDVANTCIFAEWAHSNVLPADIFRCLFDQVKNRQRSAFTGTIILIILAV